MNMEPPIPNLTSGRLLVRNAVWNLVGQLLPMAVGVLLIPPLVRSLGVDRFGLLSLAWIIIGYFSLFDLGMGRALTKLVADKLGDGDGECIPALVWTSLFVMLLLGVIGGLVTLLISPWLVHTALKIAPALQQEVVESFRLLAVSIPIVTVTSGLRGVLEAQQRFRVLNYIRIPSSIFSFAGPLLVLPFFHGLLPVIIVLVVGRLFGGAAHLIACLHSMPNLRHNLQFRGEMVMPLVHFGGWMTVSNVIGPLMSYVDRFLVGGLLSVSAVAYYTTPFDMVGRLTFISASVTGVLFPAFATTLASNRTRTAMLVGRGIKYIFLSLFPIALITVTFAPEGLHLWLGPVFAHNSQSALRWLTIGVFCNSLAGVPFALIQSAGRPSVTAKLHLVELPFYVVAVWMFTKALGIEGTAIAWTGRIILDMLLLFFFARQFMGPARTYLPKLMIAVAGALLAFAAAALPQSLVSKSAFCGLTLCIFAVATFRRLAPDERRLFGKLRSAARLRSPEIKAMAETASKP
jgi:O-antigen/teichoic acid export membrane protein